MKNPDWIDRELYPFVTKSATIEGHQMSYVDEGEGETILFVHGTPSWSFEYRHLISALKSRYRCIAPDHLGFGLSGRPEKMDGTPAAHARRLKQLIEQLGLKKFHLVVHDFGGPIGLSVAMDDPAKIISLTIINSWCWSLRGLAHFEKPSRLISTFLGKFLYEKLNFSVNVLLKAGFADKKKLTPRIHRQYRAAQDPLARKAAYQFALALLGQSDWYEMLWSRRASIAHIPTTILWGMKDSLLEAELLLERWREGLKDAVVKEIVDAGHFPQEESVEAVLEALALPLS